MKQIKFYCGIDISNETIDVCIQKEENTFIEVSFPNTTIGFKKLVQLTQEKSYHYVMESTGIYHMPLCFYLEEKKMIYSVVNALQIKRYIQMHLERNKTDKKDAKHICQYGMERTPAPYQMPEVLYFECRAINNAIETITQEITSFTNKIHSIKKLNLDNKIALKSYQNIIKVLKIELEKLDKELNQKLKVWQPKLVELLNSITGIGKRATSILIISTQGFKNTESYQQLISFAGLSPKEYSSGTSIRGKVRICKQGGGKLRHILYMCALNAKKTNPACKALFDRLVAKGKNKKLAVIAVCNKLLKQVFGVIKSGKPFDKNFALNNA